MKTAPHEPGWYTDAADPAFLRWWDGAAWTDQRKLRPSLTSSRKGAVRRASVVSRFALR